MSKKISKLPVLPNSSYLIDTHCHLDMDAFADDLEQTIERASQSNIRHIITIGIDLPSSIRAVELAKQYEMVKATVGIHPHDVINIKPGTLQDISQLAMDNNEQVVGYGEIGLDYAKNYSPPDIQRSHFRNQLSLAKELHLPVIIHDRDAHEDTLDLLKQAAPFTYGGVLHCFSGNLDFALKILELGLYISIPGIVTFKNATSLQEVAREIPLDSLIVETDGPFLAPHPRRGKRNEPQLVLYTAQKIADLKDVTLAEIADKTSSNAEKLFSLTKTNES